MRRSRKSIRHYALPLGLIALAPLHDVARAAISPEAETLELSKHLRGISDGEWSQVAGEKASEQYQILRGDTLYDISGRLFGDPRYWPKVWEINNGGIFNPHMIYPGRTVVFNPGSGSELPSVSVEGGAFSGGGDRNLMPGPDTLLGQQKMAASIVARNSIGVNDKPGPTWDDRTPRPSGEWKRLPRQTWESVVNEMPKGVDSSGIDSRSKIQIKRATGFDLESIVACNEIEPLATITGSRGSSRFLNLHDEVVLQPGIVQLETNQSYAILARPMELKNDRGNRGYSYPIQGRVKILGVNDGQYLATVTHLSGTAERGSVVVALPPKIQRIEPVAGASSLLGKIYLDRRISTFMTGQYKWVILDRGSADKVQPGNVFRVFQYKDPMTDQALTSNNMLVYGDVEVYQTCENYSVGQVVWAKGELMDETPAILMTDVEDYYTRYYLNGEAAPRESLPPPSEATQTPTDPDMNLEQTEAPPTENPDALPTEALPEAPAEDLNLEQTPAPEKPPGEGDDWLDKLDNGQELRPEEEKELEQLEKHEEPANDENSDGMSLEQTPDPSAAPSPVPNEATPSSDFESAAPGTELPPPPGEGIVDPPPTGVEELAPPPVSEGQDPDFDGVNMTTEIPESPNSPGNAGQSANPEPSPSPSVSGDDGDLPL